MRKLILVILCPIFCMTDLFADHQLHLFEEANKCYEQGNYSEAIQRYEAILHNGYESWQLYYNLGNSYFKDKKLGQAILNYERAKNLAEKNEDVLFNLELANLSVVDKISAPPGFFLFDILSDFKNFFSINTLTIIVAALYLLTMIFLIVRILVRKWIIRKLSNVIIIVAVLVLLIFSITLISRIYDLQNMKYGIILVDKINVLGSPDESGTELFSLHEGVKVQLQKEADNWRLIRLNDGKVGWVKRDVLEVI